MNSSCQDFVTFCEVHNKFFIPLNGTGDACCSRFFDHENPIFTSKGVCYSTSTTIKEHFPFQFSGVEIWTKDKNDTLSNILSFQAS